MTSFTTSFGWTIAFTVVAFVMFAAVSATLGFAFAAVAVACAMYEARKLDARAMTRDDG